MAKLFHTRGAATKKAWSPIIELRDDRVIVLLVFMRGIIPVSELGVEREDSRSGLGRSVQPEERMVLDTSLPQVLALSIAGHVETDQVLGGVHLQHQKHPH